MLSKTRHSSKAIRYSWLLAAAAACGSPAPSTKSKLKSSGDQPTFYASASNSAAVGDDHLLLVDSKMATLQRFSLSPLALESSLPLPFASTEESVLAADDGAYFMVFAGSDYAIVKRSGSAVRNPVTVQGRITGVAYDGKAHHLAIFDDLGSTALAALTPDGDVKASDVFGPVLTDTDHLVTAAAMDGGGRLVLALKGTELAVVDVDQSLAAHTWTFQRHQVAGATAIDWIAAVAGGNGGDARVLIHDGKRAAVVSTADGTISGQRDLDTRVVLGKFRGARPCLAVQDPAVTTRLSVIYADDDGAIKSNDLVVQGVATVQDSAIDLTRDTVTAIVVDGEGVGSVEETHATPIGTGPDGRARTAVIEAVIAQSEREGFGYSLRAAPLIRPLMRLAAARLWRDDLAYAERRYALRTKEIY